MSKTAAVKVVGMTVHYHTRPALWDMNMTIMEMPNNGDFLKL